MLLAIDAGHTNIVFAVYDGETQRAQWRAVTNTERTCDEYAVWLSQLLGLGRLSVSDLGRRHNRHGGPAVSSICARSAALSQDRPLIVAILRDLGIKTMSIPPRPWRRPALQHGGRHQPYQGRRIRVILARHEISTSWPKMAISTAT